ncbi:MAG: 2-oxoacid:acceptor oxidoreductase subunit alpha [Candidatus Aenigmarchaeota archaeon]|nr:2-oxoacid:acceptor oxidoreductase subunit alpha [Candidatus Aenigmarchaeota archaeon]
MKKILQGNEAIGLGAIKAGLKFYSGYPITPSSEIMHYLANQDIEFVQTEDELAAVNMAIGASLGGMKSMTSTSGPGFSLMQESIGFAHKIEVPLVIVNVQRVGPSTGMPTMPSQGDISQARYGSHGDYFPIVFYPNSVEECFKYTIEAFNASEESLSPIILLSDAFLSHLYETVDIESINFKIKQRHLKPLGDEKRHFTGLLSKGGIPQTRNSDLYKKWIQKMKEKIEKTSKNYEFFEYIENKDSDTLLIAFGITSRIISPLKENYSIFRPIRLFPILEEKLKEVAEKHKKIVVIEMNEGQYKNEIERVLERKINLIKQTGGSLSLRQIKRELDDI